MTYQMHYIVSVCKKSQQEVKDESSSAVDAVREEDYRQVVVLLSSIHFLKHKP